MVTEPAPLGIVVGVDGSPSARLAVEWAAREAILRHRPLTLVHVMTAPTVLRFGPGPNAHAALVEAQQIAERVLDGTDIEFVTHTPAAGVVPALTAMSRRADMLVVGCRGGGPVGPRLLGSVCWGLLHHAHCPVAVIHDEIPFGVLPPDAPVVVGIDGSVASEAATAWAFDEAARRDVELVAVHAGNDCTAEVLMDIDWYPMQRRAERTLAERLAGWQERHPGVRVRRVVTLDHPADRLLELSQSAQLTVLGCRGRSALAEMALGSVSSTVAQAARMPVVVVRPR